MRRRPSDSIRWAICVSISLRFILQKAGLISLWRSIARRSLCMPSCISRRCVKMRSAFWKLCLRCYLIKCIRYSPTTASNLPGRSVLKATGPFFRWICHRHGIEHRLTKPFHPWTNGQVERMNRTIKQANTKAFHYASLKQLLEHIKGYLWAYNSARPLRALKGQTPIGFILGQWHKQPQLFLTDPHPFLPGPNT